MGIFELSDDEKRKYEVICDLVENDGNKAHASTVLNISRRQVDRLVSAYKERGIEAFSHGNKGRKPVTTIPASERASIIQFYLGKYNGANFTHFTKLLSKYEGIDVSVVTVTTILESEGIYSPKLTKPKKKRIKQEIKAQEATASGKRAKAEARANLVAIEDAHPSRPRSKYAGEMEQMDASPHRWFGNNNSTLHIAIDDATGALTGAWFDTEETLNGYYHVLAQILRDYGIPCKFRTDKRTVFTYQQSVGKNDEKDTSTQFAYACKKLGIEIETTSVPQAKGRVERVFGTLQSRLPIELRIAGIEDMNSANAFLPNFLRDFNEEFALTQEQVPSAYETSPSAEQINLTLAVLSERIVDAGHCVHFSNKHYRMLDCRGNPVYYRKGTRVMCIKAFDETLFCCVNDKDVYALDEVPESYAQSEELDADYRKETPKLHYVPPMNHPWRRQAFQKFVRSQPHRMEEELLKH